MRGRPPITRRACAPTTTSPPVQVPTSSPPAANSDGHRLAARLPWRGCWGHPAATMAWIRSLALVDGWQRGVPHR
ncbi:hypothetical protein [Streptomyces sp. DASNCL29]|uniref:hypothetical protein n=1 Tax=Streptomyces sp. DASNCL29 TaxID=2583819 RepID=UPI00110FAF4E|nr:hypothetical protein [Streptomyces sp. DASNCL29]TMU90519.1 hypothetical protein FGK60_44175 [Streptomyces sp. DASNCL29]